MAFEWIHVTLRAWKKSGAPGGDEVFEILGVEPGSALRIREGTAPYETSLIYFVDENAESYASDEEPWEAFGAAISDGLLAAAKWIEARDPHKFELCRQAGIEIDLFVGGWINQDQMDLDLPAPLLRACGNAGLAISIITND